MKRATIFISGLVLLFTPLLADVASGQVNKKDSPNIIYIMTDDQRWDAFRFAGNKDIITPNLDRLAADGVVFTNAYHAVPICEPNRASIMLSQYPSRHGSGFDRPTASTITRKEFSGSYPVALREAGYFTCFIGKFGFAVTGDKVPNVGDYDPRVKRSRPSKTQLWWREENMPSERFDVWHGVPGQSSYDIGGRHGTIVRGEQAVEFIRKAAAQDKPFCLSMSMKAPHGPMQPAQEFLDMYKDHKVPSRYFNDSEEYHALLPRVVREQYRGRAGFPGEAWDIFILKYYALITGVDHVVGEIRKELEALGLDRNTIIIYTSDNGWFCGSKRLLGKDLLYEESLRAPLIVYDPRLPAVKQGTSRDALVSTIDFAPTMLDMAGVDIPGSMDGISFLPVLYEEKDAVRIDLFAENNFALFKLDVAGARDEEEKKQLLREGTVRSRCVRTIDYKYIRYHETEPMVEELFYISVDPYGTLNLAGNSEYADVLEDLRKRCNEYMSYNEGKRIPDAHR